LRTTFLLLAYNQEAYAAEAVRAALAQEGDPITILVSDDASTDRTFEVIEAAVAGYVGPHRVELNRNPYNLGLAAHVNACMARIRTDYVIAAAADDVSLPKRARRIYETFTQTNALLIHSRFEEIDRDGKSVPGSFPDRAAFLLRDTSALRAATKMGLYVGATGAWHRSLFEKYGGLDEGCYEDLILGFRAALERRVAFIDDSLVKYRVDVGITAIDRAPSTLANWRQDRLRTLSRNQSVFLQRLRDTSLSSHPDRGRIASKLLRAIRLNSLRLQSHDQGSFAFLRKNLSNPFLALYVVRSEIHKRQKAARRVSRRP
jgi:glycosyltransferase involved in cell wall biosynthesis